eukprot:gnl/TRDRNA2_/TRDRNA2_84745_c0_seq1.p1 gnl/TRDRNA2_/TRDRNA2_84745_c0~~gnl/TRDRNA2_/TRDRNA2_84745_c0_seq1.p1  ORF type:complete len:533 (-),score=120.91 gnl/TRDRNA2_/TRDRNA2_84745_c0_seq1:38-1636(-)
MGCGASAKGKQDAAETVPAAPEAAPQAAPQAPPKAAQEAAPEATPESAPEATSSRVIEAMRKGSLVVQRPLGVDINSHFDIESAPIRRHDFGFVRKATNKHTKRERAVRFIGKDSRDKEDITREVEIMKLLDHPHIVNLYEVFEDAVNYYYVVDLCAGGRLFETILHQQDFSESEAAVVALQIVVGLNYMHTSGVCHRNLKPEGLLLLEKCNEWKDQVKIADMSRACKIENGQPMQGMVGSLGFSSPQMISKGCYDQSCDLWSFGCILYTMLSGTPPFAGQTEKDIQKGTFSFPSEDWDTATDQAKDLISSLLKVDEKERYTSQQALDHFWLKKRVRKEKVHPLKVRQLENMRTFCEQNKLKKAALHVIARRLSDSEINGLRATFQSADQNKDGVVTYKELKARIMEMKEFGGYRTDLAAPEDIDEFMEMMDVNGSDVVDYSEFIAATLSKKHFDQECTLWAPFRTFDVDGSGSICRKELQQVLQDDAVKDLMGAECIARVLRDSDVDGDGQIDFKEFVSMMRDAQSTSTGS